MSQMLDFSGEAEQVGKKHGPIPSGSKVMVIMSIRTPKYPSSIYPDLYGARLNGLLYLDCAFTVIRGQYEGTSFYDQIVLPIQMQPNPPADWKAQYPCKIGGATIKAICEAANVPPRMQSITSLNGLMFPVVVSIKKKQSKKELDDGRTVYYWNNQLDRVLTPSQDQKDYQFFKQGGTELINPNGAVTGDGTPPPSDSSFDTAANSTPPSQYNDSPSSSQAFVPRMQPQPPVQPQPQIQPQMMPPVQTGYHPQMGMPQQMQQQPQSQYQPQTQVQTQSQTQAQFQSEDYVPTTYADPNAPQQGDVVPF